MVLFWCFQILSSYFRPPTASSSNVLAESFSFDAVAFSVFIEQFHAKFSNVCSSFACSSSRFAFLAFGRVNWNTYVFRNLTLVLSSFLILFFGFVILSVVYINEKTSNIILTSL